MEEPRPEQSEFIVPEFAHRQLTDEHRAAGFVTPPRETYIHAGRSVCGKPRGTEHIDRPGKRDGKLHVCTMDAGHKGKCHKTTIEVAFTSPPVRRLGGCHRPTTMIEKHIHAHARNPKCRTQLHCSNCDEKFPATDFVWLDGQEHGADPIQVGDTAPKPFRPHPLAGLWRDLPHHNHPNPTKTAQT